MAQISSLTSDEIGSLVRFLWDHARHLRSKHEYESAVLYERWLDDLDERKILSEDFLAYLETEAPLLHLKLFEPIEKA